MSRGLLVKVIDGRLALMGVSCVFALLLSEAAVRIFDLAPVPLAPLDPNTYQLSKNPLRRFEYKPGYRSDQPPFDDDHVSFEVNSAGFRDREFKVEKTPGVQRIMVLGDSISAGNGIRDINQTYSRKLEYLLHDLPTQARYEVYNFSVGGYDTLQEAATLQDFAPVYRPDIILVGFCLNDFWTDDGGVVESIKNSRMSSFTRFAVEHSRLVFMAYYRLKSLLGQDGLWSEYPPKTVSYRGRVLRGSNRVDLALNWIQQLSYDLHFQVYIFLIPGFDQPFSAYRHDDIHKQLAMIVSNYPGIKLVDLLEDFRSQGLSAESIAYDGLHPNARGHDALAGMFFQHLSHALTKQK